MLRRLGIGDVVFDLGGVLVDWDPRYLFRDHLGHPSAAVEHFLANVCTPQWHWQLDAGRPFALATRELAERFPEHAAWIDAYSRDWSRMFAGEFTDTVEFLRELKARGLRVHALSNYPAERVGFLYRKFAFMREFDTVVLSGLIGATKPDQAIFAYLQRRIGFRPSLFLDDCAENVAAARGCGIEAVHFVGREGAEALWALLE